jgi:hypothetical protein
LAPTTSWWWKETRPRGSCRRVAGLADVVQQRRQPQHQVRRRRVRGRPLQRDRLVQHGQRVAVDVLVLVVLVDLHAQRRQLGQDDVGQAGGDEQLQRLAGSGLQQRLRQLGLHALRRDPGELADMAVRASTTSSTGVTPSWATKRTARSIRSGSSAKESDAAPGVRSRRAEQVAEPAEGVADRAVGAERDGHGVDREVAAGEVVDQRRPQATSGSRETRS